MSNLNRFGPWVHTHDEMLKSIMITFYNITKPQNKNEKKQKKINVLKWWGSRNPLLGLNRLRDFKQFPKIPDYKIDRKNVPLDKANNMLSC